MQNKLLECASSIFTMVTAFQDNDNGANLPENFRQRILQVFDQFERAAFEQKIPVLPTQQAKYALVAFIDELVLSSAWAGREQWMGAPLQLQFFGEHLAGENFFQRLQNLRQNPQANIDILEIYFLCLQLGFEGIYRLRGLENLLALQVDLRSQIEIVRGTVDSLLSPQGLPQQNIIAKVGAQLPFWVIISVTAAILFFIYFGFAVAIDHQANMALRNINASKNELFSALPR